MVNPPVGTRLRTLVHAQLGIPVHLIVPDANLQVDLGANSLDAVELIMAAEELFEIEIDPESADMLTFGTFAALVERTMARRWRSDTHQQIPHGFSTGPAMLSSKLH